MFDWNDLRYFLAVARAGSTLAAARALGVNQSTVIRRLAALEERIGCRLFERHPAGYRITEPGAELRPYAERVEDAVAALERRLAARDARLTGTLRVTCAEGMGYRLLTPLLHGFHAKYPGLRVDLVIADRYLDLAKGEADVAVRAGEQPDSALVGRKIADNAWAVYASRSYVERHGRPERVEGLDGHTLIGFDGGIAAIHAARWLRSVAPRATIAVRCNSVVGLLLAAKSGVGLAVLPVHIGDPEDELVRVLDPVPELMAQIWLLTHPDLRRTPRVRAFFDFVVAEISAFHPLLLGHTRREDRRATDGATSGGGVFAGPPPIRGPEERHESA